MIHFAMGGTDFFQHEYIMCYQLNRHGKNQSRSNADHGEHY